MKTRTLTLAGAWMALTAAAGCSGTVVENTGGGGTGGTGGGGAGGGGVCSSFHDEEGIGSVTLHFRNESTETIFLPATCMGEPEYRLSKTDDDDDTVSFPLDRSCLQTCEDLETEPQFACGACAPMAVRIEPGATHDVVWDGTGHRGGNAMPAQCWKQPQANGTCSMIAAARPGPWSANTMARSECTDCTCDANGKCFGTVSGLSGYAEGAAFTFPTSTDVDVVFGPCTFGCAD